MKQNSDSTIFIRGQVWYWEDPIYGDKNGGKEQKVQLGEKTTRYSRYVLIVQNTDTIKTNCILVVPCTTSEVSEYMVPIVISHLSQTNVSNADVKRIMPVHPKRLKRYICTLSEAAMERIDKCLFSLLFEEKSIDRILNPIEDEHFEPVEDNSNIIEESLIPSIKFLEDNKPDFTFEERSDISDFSLSYVQFTGDANCVDNDEIMFAYNKFAFENGLQPIYDKKKLIDLFTDYLCNKYESGITFDKDKISGIKLRPNELAMTIDSLMENHDNNIIFPPMSDLKKWNEYSIEIFRKMYNKMGDKYTAEYFDVKLNTAQKYMNQWEKRAWYHTKDEFYVMSLSFNGIPYIVNLLGKLLTDAAVSFVDNELSEKIYGNCNYDLFNRIARETIYSSIEQIIQNPYPGVNDDLIETYKMIYVLDNDIAGDHKLEDLINDNNFTLFMKKYHEIYPHGGIDTLLINDILNKYIYELMTADSTRNNNENEDLGSIESYLIKLFGPKEDK